MEFGKKGMIMQSIRTLSLLLIVQLVASGFITQCPVSHAHGSNAHLISESCEHECEAAESSHGDGCQHGLCNHTAAADEFLTSQQERSLPQGVVPTPVAGYLAYPSTSLRQPLSMPDIPAYSHIATTILRI